MSLTSGTRLGPYEIESALGAGGMGEVYKARDTRLERTVAIKVLPAHFSSNADLKQRFEREAKTISSLNHPNICTLHDVGHDSGTDYLVLEFIEGETLAQRLGKGALPVKELLRVGAEIADALDKAHRAGIVHRDLKPGNVMLTKSGAKLLDFGLAKPQGGLMAASATHGALTQTSPASPITQQGTLVGTFQYMSPEQVEGREADTRSDIFALGAVLYEMATGKRAFDGKSQISVASAILEKDPEPISAVQPLAPAALDHVVRRALAKSPDDRWQSASDVRAELRWIAQSSSQAAAPLAMHSRRRPPLLVSAIAAAVAVLAGVFAWWAARATAPRPVVRTSIPLPPHTTPFVTSNHVLAISPDGMTVAFVAFDEKRDARLFLRRLDSFTTTEVPNPTNLITPVFSPDGTWLAFATQQNRLMKMQVTGGTPIELADCSGVGIFWGDDDYIYFEPGFATGIYRIPSGGGTPQRVTKVLATKDDRAHLWPQLLPGAKAIVYTVFTGGSFDDARIEAMSLRDGKRVTLVEGGTFARYVPTGHLVYARGGTLFAVGFDAANLKTNGTPVPVLDNVLTGASNGDARYAFSNNGTLVYEPGGLASLPRNLYWVDRKGNMAKITETVQPFGAVDISPDGRRAAVTIESSTYDVWIYDFERDGLTKLTFGGDDEDGKWSPDGKNIAYHSTKEGQAQIYVKHLAGGGEDRITEGDAPKSDPSSWLPDGSAVVVGIRNPDTNVDLYAIPVAGDHKPRLLAGGPFAQTEGRVSPDGKWLLYVSDESGSGEVYLQSMADTSVRFQVSQNGGSAPRWAPSGREIFYTTNTGVYSVAFGTEPAAGPSKPVLLFLLKNPWHYYTVARDGSRFLVSAQGDVDLTKVLPQINVIQNWFEELKQQTRGK